MASDGDMTSDMRCFRRIEQEFVFGGIVKDSDYWIY